MALARLTAEEAGCLHGPFPFADAHTRRACLSGRNVPPSQALFDDTWGAVIQAAPDEAQTAEWVYTQPPN